MQNRIEFKLKDAEIIYYPDFFSKKESCHYFNILLQETLWQQDNITLFGKTYKQPRLTSLYADNNKSYTYSNITMQPNKLSNTLKEIKTKVESITNESFTTCLLNLYRNGWHADNEKELGKNPIIASISFGADRKFYLKHKTREDLKHKIILQHGSLLLMKGTTQHFWLHQIPKTRKQIGKRINLTF